MATLTNTIKHLSGKDAVTSGLLALKDACSDGGFDFSSLDLADLSAKDAKAVRIFAKTLKRGSEWDTVRGAFKAYCLGAPINTSTKERTIPKEALIAKVESKRDNKVSKSSPKEKVAVVTADPIVHNGVGDLTVDMKHGSISLFDHSTMTFKYELLKRKECYEINFKWVTVKGHTLTDKVLLPHKSAPTESALKLWIGKIARRLVLVYLSPYGAMQHPADSQGIINEERNW